MNEPSRCIITQPELDRPQRIEVALRQIASGTRRSLSEPEDPKVMRAVIETAADIADAALKP